MSKGYKSSGGGGGGAPRMPIALTSDLQQPAIEPEPDNSVAQADVASNPALEEDALATITAAISTFPDLAMTMGTIHGRANEASIAIDTLNADTFGAAVGSVMEAGYALEEHEQVTASLSQVS